MALALYFTCDETDHISATIAGNALIEDARWSQYVKGFACWAERETGLHTHRTVPRVFVLSP